ncbi:MULTISPECIES: NAD(P)-dependent alcohol dehydrogenase [unclassified Halorhabdus]|uniref:zinc-dependent alcohol dehydrogenase family protein n=1 Tax=unclassified Halorhabdus TaxID=2621901 RepID=UPI0023DAFF41|nr:MULTISPECIES: NAD(P)-dependent alcohol dehydrogenase [unclassified Halorhabdus]WEL18467.1 NADPH:quinone reductase [Halorhabdus sp. SVX81]WEL22353.1 NADPH:quinone reductase [Halorhabdus sp. BNX81]
MRAYEVTEPDTDYEGVVQVDRDRPTPAADEALVRIHAASLNYRDLAIANADLAYPGASLPVVPFSDGAGEVVAVGEGVERLSEGDRVATPFAPDWIDGPATPEKTRRTTGGNVDGALAEYATFPAESLPRLPEYLSYTGGAALSCAGLTAWRALIEDGGLSADETVLALGTGGVSTFALQFATMHGARTVVTSSSDAKLDRARDLGADVTINYESTPEWGEAVAEATGGVDHVVEVGGPGTLEQSLVAVGFGGHVHLIGVLAGQDGLVHPGPILGKAVDVEGVTGVGSRAMFDRMLAAMETAEMDPVIDRVFAFDAVRDAYRYVDRGDHQGKVVVDLE